MFGPHLTFLKNDASLVIIFEFKEKKACPIQKQYQSLIARSHHCIISFWYMVDMPLTTRTNFEPMPTKMH